MLFCRCMELTSAVPVLRLLARLLAAASCILHIGQKHKATSIRNTCMYINHRMLTVYPQV
jgi:hypothetical protein